MGRNACEYSTTCRTSIAYRTNLWDNCCNECPKSQIHWYPQIAQQDNQCTLLGPPRPGDSLSDNRCNGLIQRSSGVRFHQGRRTSHLRISRTQIPLCRHCKARLCTQCRWSAPLHPRSSHWGNPRSNQRFSFPPGFRLLVRVSQCRRFYIRFSCFHHCSSRQDIRCRASRPLQRWSIFLYYSFYNCPFQFRWTPLHLGSILKGNSRRDCLMDS
jgi:hypothetical protein